MMQFHLKTVLSALVVLGIIFAQGQPVHAGQPVSLPPQEEFKYNIKFLMFTRAAQGRLRIYRQGVNRYRAELIAETKGLIGILMYGRKNHYISELEFNPKNRQFISRLYTKLVYRQSGIERTTAAIDTKNGLVKWKYYFRDKLIGEGVDPLPKGARVEDLLSAFFNFRLGSLGPLEPGRKMVLFTLPNYKAKALKENFSEEEKKFQKFEITIPHTGTMRTYRKKFGRTKEKGLLALVKVPKSLFGQETGEVRVWFNPKMAPIAATVEDAILFGDVSGTLIKSKNSP